MKTWEFRAELVGGPRDGERYDLTFEVPEGSLVMKGRKVKLKDHEYRLVELDEKTKTAKLLW